MSDQNEIFRYEQLVERSVKAQEASVLVSQSLLEVSKNLQDNIRQLNDKFVLHAQCTEDAKKGVEDIKETFMKWIKILAILLFFMVGGSSLVRLLTEVNWTQILKVF